MQTLSTITTHLRDEHNLTLEICHVRNEHGREEADENRTDLECRVNANVDAAARKAAALSPRRDGAAEPQQDGMGQYTTFSVDARRCEGNIKEVVEAKGAEQVLTCVLGLKELGRTARGSQSGEVHTLATIMARKLMGTKTLEAHTRALFVQTRASMWSLEAAANRDGPQSGMAKFVSKLGAKDRYQCPSCFNLETWEGKEDGHYHLRHECSHPTLVAVRRRLADCEHERVVRSGRRFHAYPEEVCTANELTGIKQQVQAWEGLKNGSKRGLQYTRADGLSAAHMPQV
jgi:hypothetical protein